MQPHRTAEGSLGRLLEQIKRDWQWGLHRTVWLAAAGCVVAGTALAAPPDNPFLMIQQGSDWFKHVWQPNDARSKGGDGLGPMFNANSCVACHNQGGSGGGGAAEHDVELLVLVPPKSVSSASRATFAQRIRQIHPTFVNGGRVSPSITLHKFGTHPAYEKWRVVQLMLVDQLSDDNEPERIGLKVVKRNTPALFGAGEIDRIPDEVLIKVAQRQQREGGKVKGRVARASTGGVGRFGWRGQTGTLRDFVRGACANELGLHVPGIPQPLDPLAPGPSEPRKPLVLGQLPRDPSARSQSPSGLDLDEQACDELVAYVASLPAPSERLPSGREESHAVGRRTSCLRLRRLWRVPHAAARSGQRHLQRSTPARHGTRTGRSCRCQFR